MFLAIKGIYTPCGMFTIGHFVLVLLTSIIISMSVKFTKDKSKEEVYTIIKKLSITIFVLEIFRIGYVLYSEGEKNVNEYLPLYYCSLLIYASIFSSFGKGILKRVGDVFLATGSIVGGTIFILFPTTSLPSYPVFHFISLHSYFFHGTMVYLGLLVNITNYIELQKSDISYYASLVSAICIIAYIVNKKFGSNLMFISQNFPGTILEIFYNVLGPFYTLFMYLVQIILPFYFIYYSKSWILKLNRKIKQN